MASFLYRVSIDDRSGERSSHHATRVVRARKPRSQGQIRRQPQTRPLAVGRGPVHGSLIGAIDCASRSTGLSGLPSRDVGVCAWLEWVLFELAAGFDSELAECFAEVVVDGVGADEQL